ncbi:MAG: transcription antitermination factor NusB, partial [Acidimicrobiia bacterium]
MSDSRHAPGTAARQLAVDALVRIDRDRAYANLVLPPMLATSGLDDRDRGFVTELVYGTTRMRRACDWLVDRYLPDPARVDVVARSWLRIGAYQAVFLGTPAHAAVGATVGAAPRRLRGLCNAILRKVTASMPVQWPSDAVRLSVPDWMFEQLCADLGVVRAIAAVEAMDASATVTVRTDGYVQDLGSQLVVDAVGVEPGDLVLDLCAAPGGKATAMVARGAHVVAADLRPARTGLILANRRALDLAPDRLGIIAADGTRPPLRDGVFDKVLLDAPCSGLGSLRRRPDARWRIGPDDIGGLVELQRTLLDRAVHLVRPGGEVVFSVCTITVAETLGIDEWVAEAHPSMTAFDAPGAPWEPLGRGALLLPQTAGTDGMYVLRLRRADSQP